MTATSAPTSSSARVDTDGILRDGKYVVLDRFALSDDLYPKVIRTFLEGIESIAGRDVRERVESAGLAKMHEHFPASKLLLLEDYLLKNLQRDLYYWSFRVGRDDLGLTDRFFVDHLIVMRIYYPFLVSKEAKEVEKPPYPLWEKSRLAWAALKNWKLIANEVTKAREKRRQRSAYKPEAYHQKLPEVARAHGAHIDTWYGHSYDGMNLWWSIAGVNQHNTVLLYPGMFGYKYPYDPANMYLAEGVPVTEPHTIVTNPNELLVFNPEMLHGTHVNISDETRIVITTRLNPGQPRFDLSAAWSFEHWYASDDLERKRFSAISVFPAHKHRGEPSFTFKEGTPAPETRMITHAGPLTEGDWRAVCPSSDLADGEKIAVNFDNVRLFVVRTKGRVTALHRICPHLSFDMVAAYHDEESIYCPGHGVGFSLADGSSHCNIFTLQQYEVEERDGQIFLHMPASE